MDIKNSAIYYRGTRRILAKKHEITEVLFGDMGRPKFYRRISLHLIQKEFH
jgi:hypothetical protein